MGERGTHELLTIDVWDTLLRRRCHPDSVKLQVCRYVALKYASYLSPEIREPWVLLRLRQQAEKELGDESRQRGLDDEYRHGEVYRRWLTLAGLAPSPLGEEDLKQLLPLLERVEIAQEKFVSYVDPEVAAMLADYSTARRVFLSDFYLPATAIEELLTHHGIRGWVEGGVVSCEVGLNKRSGRLYRHLHQSFGVGPDRHLHVGDNFEVDVRAAKRIGITAVHFQPPAEHARRRQREAAFHARSTALQEALESLQTTEAPRQEPNYAEIYAYGRRCSLLLVSFVAQVMEKAVADGVQRLYFCTREGEFFLDIYRRLAAQDWLGFLPPPAQLLEVSRIATFAGSLEALSVTELMRLWNQYSTQSLYALLKSLDLEPSLFVAAAACYDLHLQVPIRYPWQDPRLKAFLGDGEIKETIDRHLRMKREQLIAYLESVGLRDRPGQFGIVDIGWRGTIQDNLAYVLPSLELHGYYLGLQRFLNHQPANTRKEAFGPNLNREEAYGHLLDFVAPLEMLCNSLSGSVMRYERREDGRVRVHRHVDAEENQVYETCVRYFQAGVLDTVPEWANFLRTHAYSSMELRPLAMTLWEEIVRRPPPFLARAYFQLNHNETFGVGGFADKRRMLAAGDVLKAFVSRKSRLKLHGFLQENGWVSGLLVCPDVDPGFRRMLSWFLWALNVRRWVRQRFFSGGFSS